MAEKYTSEQLKTFSSPKKYCNIHIQYSPSCPESPRFIAGKTTEPNYVPVCNFPISCCSFEHVCVLQNLFFNYGNAFQFIDKKKVAVRILIGFLWIRITAFLGVSPVTYWHLFSYIHPEGNHCVRNVRSVLLP
jgi:hypothetical protein